MRWSPTVPADAGRTDVPPGARRAGRHRVWREPFLGRAGRGATAALQEVSYLIFPSECVVCGAVDAVLCPGCARRLRQEGRHPFRADQGLAETPAPGETLPVIAAADYRDAVAAVLLACKNHGRPQLAHPLGRLLAGAIDALPVLLPGELSGTVLLVPIPGSAASWRRRGYDPVVLLLRGLRGRLPPGWAVMPMLACRGRAPWRRRAQKTLGRRGRRGNVRNGFRLRRRRPDWAAVRGATVVLVDDVMTTGSTLREAARTLALAGLEVRGAVVVAAAGAPKQGRRKVSTR